VADFSVQVAEAEQQGLAAALAIDTSGSMQGKPLADAQAAARVFLDGMGPRDRAALVGFGDTVQVLQDFTGDRAALDQAVGALAAKGDTALYDAVFQATAAAAREPLGRRAVIVLTDGEDTRSSLTLDDAINKAREANTPVFALGFGQVKPEALKRLTLVTGGRYDESPGSEQLAAGVKRIADQLRQQYVLRYQAPDSRPPENEVQVIVSRDGQDGRDARRFPAPPLPPLGLNLAGPAAGSTVSGAVELKPTLANASRVDKVEYVLDGRTLASVSEPPYAFTWDTSGVPPGQHELVARASIGDRRAEQSIQLTVAAPTPVATATAVPAAVAAAPTVPPTIAPSAIPTATARPSSDAATGLPIPWPALAAVGIVLIGGLGLVLSRRRSGDSDATLVDQVAYPPPDNARTIDPAAVVPTMADWSPEASGSSAGEHDRTAVMPLPPAGWSDGAEQPTMVGPLQPSPEQRPAASLTALVPDVGVQTWPLDSDEIVIGREAGHGVIFLNDALVSRHHARITWEGGAFLYRDLSPTNPTLLGGQPIENPHRLTDGDRLLVGRTELAFHQVSDDTLRS
jgi:LPXTG-motif cell wall-anchored protein